MAKQFSWNVLDNYIEFKIPFNKSINDGSAIMFVDTETTGLDIMNDTAFQIPVGFVNTSTKIGYVYVIESKEEWDNFSKTILPLTFKVVGHNFKYDMHIIKNTFDYEFDKVDDTLIISRLMLPFSIKTLALKTLAKSYISNTSKELQDNIKNLQTKIKAQQIISLTAFLKPYVHSFSLKTGKPLSWTYKRIEESIKDPMVGLDLLPKEVKDIYLNWAKEIGHKNIYDVFSPSYKVINDHFPKEMKDYASHDIILTAEIYYKF